MDEDTLEQDLERFTSDTLVQMCDSVIAILNCYNNFDETLNKEIYLARKEIENERKELLLEILENDK